MGSCQSSPSAAPPPAVRSADVQTNGQNKESKILMTTSPTETESINAVEAPLAVDNSSSNQSNQINGHSQLLLLQNKRPSQGDISISSNLSSNSNNSCASISDLSSNTDSNNSCTSISDHYDSSNSSSDHKLSTPPSLSSSLHRKSNSNTALQLSSSSTKSLDLSTSHRRRKSRRQLAHSDSKVGLHELISGDVKNTNLVRIEVPLGKPIEEVYDGVHDGDILGSGISGIVRLVKHKKTGVQYAVKCLDLALIDSEEGLMQLKEEIYIMCQLVRHIHNILILIACCNMRWSRRRSDSRKDVCDYCSTTSSPRHDHIIILTNHSTAQVQLLVSIMSVALMLVEDADAGVVLDILLLGRA